MDLNPRVLNHGGAVHGIRNLLRYGIDCKAIVWNQAAGGYTLARDEIQGRRAALDDIHDYVVMIYQAYGSPQSSSSSLRGTPTAAWITKKAPRGCFFVVKER